MTMIPRFPNEVMTCAKVPLVVAAERKEFFDTAVLYKAVSADPAPVEDAADEKDAETF